eukprot:GHVU01050691.1.p1 GENE.GHVU01050691.1~~GHVU01050691.1.p1  ORF type:complete len:229 (-),score=37.89 GHVU01050691.1:1229-1915(-)
MSERNTSDPYARALGASKLVLKGKTEIKKKKSKRSHRVKGGDPATEEASEKPVDVPLSPGTGRLVSSGPTVHGFESAFKEECEPGDIVYVHHPTTLEVEGRTVVSVMSQRSMTLSGGFSSDLVSTTEFHVKKESINVKRAAEKALEKRRLEAGGDDEGGTEEDLQNVITDEISKRVKHKLDKAKPVFSYREKIGMWSYATKTVTMDKETSREELLDMRVKQGRDKFCW